MNARLACTVVFVFGLIARCILLEEPWTPELITLAEAASPNASPLQLGDEITIDVTAVEVQLHELAVEERAEQIADWAVYGTLLHAGLDAETIRDATFDRTPMRLPSLEETFNFEYGPGRHIVVDDEVWLFYSEYDPMPTATLARLADVTRVAWAEIPESFRIHRFRSDLVNGSIVVTREDDVAGDVMFSAAYGYHEAKVRDIEELTAWLGTVDDVTHAALTGSGAITLGGRRFEENRSLGIEIEDVAALYQAHVELAENRKPAENAGAVYFAAFTDLVNQYNANVAAYAPGRTVGVSPELQARFDDVRRLLSTGSPDHAPPTRRLVRSLEQASTEIDELEPLIQRAAESVTAQALEQRRREGLDVSEEPGFSLDPQWNTSGLLKDLETLKDTPNELVRQAEAVVEAWKDKDVDDAAKPTLLWAAENVVASRDAESNYALPNHWSAKLHESIAALRGRNSLETDRGLMLPYYQLKDEVRQAASLAATRAEALLGFIEARSRVQCARYDGPLDGTRVGMNLFYTDVIAKLWASDYSRKAPTEAILGFKTHQSIGPLLEDVYAEEEKKYPSTRLWFGPNPTGFVSTLANGVSFAPIATRIYAAGRNHLEPGKETAAAESSRRVLGWWNRHYRQVADHEQQYHVQNQIMKWSIITGWMLERGTLRDLSGVEVFRDHRFDRWYAEQADLRFRDDVRLLPPDAVPSPTECMEVLHSYPFEMFGEEWWIEGGVSLGGRRSLLNQVERSGAAIPRQLRRPGLDHAASSPTASKFVNGARFERPTLAHGTAKTIATPSDTARFRVNGVDMRISEIRTQLSRQGSSGKLALESDSGSFGTLGFTKNGNGVKLSWERGSLSSDGTLLGRMSETGSAQRLTTADGFLPRDGVYVMETESGMSAIVARTGESPRLLQQAGRGESAASMRASTSGAKSIAEAVPLENSAVESRLGALHWQRLSPIESGPSGVAGRVERVFSNKAPSTSGRPVRIETGDPEIPVVKGVYEDGALHLERPPGATTAFDDLVTSRAMDNRTLHDIGARARSGDTEPLHVELGRDPGTILAARVHANDFAGAARVLREAARKDGLEAAMKGFRQRTAELQLHGIRTGGRTNAGRVLTRPKHATPDELLARALDDLPNGQARLVVDDLGQLFAANSPSPSALQAAAKSPHASHGLRSYLDAKAAGIVSERIGPITFKASGNKLHTVLTRPTPSKGRKLSATERGEYLRRVREQGDVDVYVEESALLRTRDWDAVPTRTLSEVESQGKTQWLLVEPHELGATRPDRIVTPHGEYLRREMSTVGDELTGTVRPILVIRQAGDSASGDGDDDQQAADAEHVANF